MFGREYANKATANPPSINNPCININRIAVTFFGLLVNLFTFFIIQRLQLPVFKISSNPFGILRITDARPYSAGKNKITIDNSTIGQNKFRILR